jgi:hypothetical protein
MPRYGRYQAGDTRQGWDVKRRHRVTTHSAAALCLALLFGACGGSNSVTNPTAVPAATPERLSRLEITGNIALTAVDETSQLTAVATFSDGVVKDVSRDSSWQSLDPSVIAISSTGLVTVVQLGTAIINARYQTQSTGLRVTATQTGTFAVWGVVAEPGQGPLADVRVLDTTSSRSTRTSTSGLFSLVSLASSQIHLRFDKAGYEPVDVDAKPGASAFGRVQQIVRLVAGETVTPHHLAPNDLTYAVGDGQRCNSCRLIRIVVPVKGTLHLHLTWSQACVVALGLWVGGRHVVPDDPKSTELDADVAAGPGETIIYVDRATPSGSICHVPFVLETSVMQ